LLEELPFDLMEAHNDFWDPFSVLCWKAPLDRYVEAAEWPADAKYRGVFEVIAKAVGEVASTYVRFVAVDLDRSEGPAIVEAPNLRITSDVVERALKDAEHLVRDSGAVSGVDRVHTAFHGYLRAACEEAGLEVPDEASVTRLFRILREGHPKLAASGARSDDVQRVIASFGNVIDALNTIRNQASIAHPNESLLEEPEAMLLINAARTLLHYLNTKLA
jgi:hypothetical protein